MSSTPPPAETDSESDIDTYLKEACYYLRKKGLSDEEISSRLEISEEKARQFYRSYESKIKQGIVREDEVDRRLWEDVHDDAIGNEKVTFVRDDGFYHCKRSDLETMDSTGLMSIFESSKKFLDYDIYRRYLGSKPPVGYDPMALQRQVNRAIQLIEEILKARWVKQSSSSSSTSSTPKTE